VSVVGIGTDLVAVARIRRLHDGHGDRFLSRILTEPERRQAENYHDPVAFLARRYAAKEAAVKALGTGIAAGVGFHDIEVLNDERGAPRITFGGEAARRAEALGANEAHVSISDEREYALAFVVLAR
jgi:holo-[acyl-carrier protein] synthase